MKAKSPKESRVTMTELVLPEHTNALGTIFGGQILAWMDTAAAIAAYRHGRKPCVTASIDSVDFISPVKVGHIVILQANVNYTGKTSMEVGVKVSSEDPFSGKKQKTASAYLTFVCMDQDGQSAEVPPLKLSTDQEKRWFKEGKKRKQEWKKAQYRS